MPCKASASEQGSLPRQSRAAANRAGQTGKPKSNAEKQPTRTKYAAHSTRQSTQRSTQRTPQSTTESTQHTAQHSAQRSREQLSRQQQSREQHAAQRSAAQRSAARQHNNNNQQRKPQRTHNEYVQCGVYICSFSRVSSSDLCLESRLRHLAPKQEQGVPHGVC